MAYELREGIGNAFVNKFKEKDNQPDFTADILDEGKLKQLALWKKKTKNGETYLGFTLKLKIEKEQPKDYPSGDFKNLDDDIPF